MNVLITDCDCKHSIALQRYIRRALPDVRLIGYSAEAIRFARYFGYCHEYVERKAITDALSSRGIEMVIPVGGASVQAVCVLAPNKAVLPSHDSLRLSYDKGEAIRLAERLEVPAPRTVRIRVAEDVKNVDVGFPCVVKPANEVEGKFVEYPRDPHELAALVQRSLAQLGATSSGVLVQEYVAGRGAGFFALYDRGRPLRIFMHRRIREWPVSGGASTAARAIRDASLMRLGTTLLDALSWNGVAMVEFKFKAETGDYVFMELNGKFWGSSELALSAGVNFGADLIRLFRGEQLTYDESYDDAQEFYWPLDGDLLALWSLHELRHVRQYFGPHARTNLRQSFQADALKILAFPFRLARLTGRH